MAEAKKVVEALVSCGAGLFTGVPDSLLSKFSACVMNQKELHHIIAANEGNAIGLAIGDYLASSKPSVVYMQNSGLGNVVNPITSLVDPEVCSIPMVLIIGWRGEPGSKDEPQHVKQGEITLGQLNVLNIPFAIIEADTDVDFVISKLWSKMLIRQGPVALVVKKGALSGSYPVEKKDFGYKLKREDAIRAILCHAPKNAFFVATTGKTGRELYELRQGRREEQRDFLTVGGMGHASSIAHAVALQQKDLWTICLDGDGAAIMHMGAMATLGSYKPRRFLHVVLNNCAHESVGGQPTVAANINFEKLSQAFGYDGYHEANSTGDIALMLNALIEQSGLWLLEIKLAQGSREDLGRPIQTPIENKISVMKFLAEVNE